MRIAFFGGSFDPPHRGHIAIATAAGERLRLDRVLFAPVGRQPLKRDGFASSYENRCAMVELAVAQYPMLELSLVDAPHVDGRPNYTIETLEKLKTMIAPGDKLFCLLGADSFLMLRQWHRASELLTMCDFIVASRPGFSFGDLANAMPGGLTALDRPPSDPSTSDPPEDSLTALASGQTLSGKSGYRSFRIGNELGRESTLYLLLDLDEDVSATQIRAALAGSNVGESGGDAGKGLLSPAVLDYIENHGLYAASH